MKSTHVRMVVATLVCVAAVGPLAACSSTATHPVVEPITVSSNKLQGETIKVSLDGDLNITTGSLSVTSYSGTVSDPSIAKFVPGRKTSTLELDPSVKPLKVGETKVTLKNKNGGIQDVVFTLDVTK
jgi:hypothetical protein